MDMIMNNVDLFDQDTWPLLTEMRQELRDAIFDADSEAGRRALEVQLAAVQDDINDGLTRYIPF